MILVMSVHPGFGGQSFIAESLEKLRAVRREIERRGLKVDVEVDGGIKIDNIRAAAEAGANVFVSGSGIFGHENYRTIIADMRERAACD
jgi:ribulose-phosphate 3-epimerase